MEKETIKKSNTGIVIFKLSLEFEENVFTYFHLPPYGISFYLRNVFYFQRIVLCLISVKHIYTFVLLNMFCQYIVLNVKYVMSRKIHCKKVLYCDTNKISTINIFFSGPVQNIFI